MEDYLQVGVITTTHGLKGEVKVFPTTDDVNRFFDLKEVYLDTGKEKITLEVEKCRFFKQFVILKFKGIDDINEVEQYKKCPILVTRENAVPLEEDEYFIADLIGLKILTETGIEVGVLKDVISTGANDVYAVTLPDGGEILLPAIKDCIMDVDMEAGEMIVHLMKGLVE
ncbi:MAG: ribosome maturation factor RimM [Lachnospiraceae bacterium]|nr:ribosome maturation factor RimM [Lachnospiraceae bacterium]